ncbi:MAG: uL30 family ribosomal protein, partial [Nanoarchaeota archaeon]
MNNTRLVIVRVRGVCKLKKKTEATMRMLRLFKKNHCSIVKNSKQVIGMIQKIKDYVTWGELDEGTMRLLLEKRGRIIGNKPLQESWFKTKAKMDYDSFIKDYFELKTELKNIAGIKP